MLELILISLCTLVLTGICSFLAESLTSVSHNRLTELSEHGKPAQKTAAATMLEWKRDIQSPRTAIFIVDLIVYTIGCVSFGGYAVIHLSGVAVGAVALIATAILLMFGHLLPRALGERYASETVVFTVRATQVLLVAMLPLVRLVQEFFRWLAPPNRADEETTREELSEILETAREDGSLDADEYQILKNIIRYTDVLVSDVMTPRTVVFSYHAETSIHEALQLPEFRQYSRFPVRDSDDLDSVIGYVLARDVLWAMIHGQGELALRDVMRDVYFIPENIELDRALKNFLGRREHLFIVVDEYGGVEGLLTMEDVMETILGVEILDEADRVTNLRQYAKERRDQRIATLRAQNVQVDTAHTDDDALSPLGEYDELSEGIHTEDVHTEENTLISTPHFTELDESNDTDHPTITHLESALETRSPQILSVPHDHDIDV
jgi:CBS domain containing-hemolysin-like protein